MFLLLIEAGTSGFLAANFPFIDQISLSGESLRKVGMMFSVIILLNFLALLFLVMLFIRLFCTIVVVQGPSMSPALDDGDRIVALNWWPRRCLRRNQIILLRPVYSPLPDKQYLPASSKQIHIKRIVALAGETIITSLADVREETRLRIARFHDEQGKRTWLIPPQHLFVRGDNHMNSTDSLVSGPLPWESVCGVVLLKLPCTFSLFPRRKDHASTL